MVPEMIDQPTVPGPPVPDSSAEQTFAAIDAASSPCLQGETVTFTGTLASMTHAQAQQLADEHGGSGVGHVSKQTTMLVIGEEGWPLEEDGQPSVKLRQVSQWREAGTEIRVLNESEWLHLLNLEEQRRETHQLYTPAMLSQLLDVSANVIRRWERIGLIKAIRKVFRLPYFDFQEVAGARRLSQLLQAGVSRSELESSLSKLSSVMGGMDRSLAQLEILAQDSHLVFRDEVGLLEPASGQRLLDFEPVPQPTDDQPASIPADPGRQSADDTATGPTEPTTRLHWSFQDWFDRGCRLLEDNELSAAVEAFRICLMDRFGDPEVNFHLAEALYRQGQVHAALERYHVAVEADHDYIEAWTQLGCLHDELGQPDAALEAFEIALNTHPHYPEANFHKAQLLHNTGRTEDAVSCWQQYLKCDSRGPWADIALQRLEDAGATCDTT